MAAWLQWNQPEG